MHDYTVPPMQRPTVSIKVCRQLLGDISNDRCWRFIREKEIEAVKLGGRTMVLTSSIQAFIDRQRGVKQVA